MEPMTLTTDRLHLRPLEMRDVEPVVAACQDPDIPRWTTVPSPYTREHAIQFIGTVAPTGWREDSHYNFGVFTRGSGTAGGGALVGTIGLLRLARLATPEHEAELGYWTAKEQRGRGYTAEAARAVCTWAFESLGVERIEWFAEAGNVGSRAVALKVGFVMEGTIRSKTVYEGTRRDVWSGSLLPSDWGRGQATPYLPHPRSEA